MSGLTSSALCATPWLVISFVVACKGQEEARAPLVLSANDEPGEQLAEPPMETVYAPITDIKRADVDTTIEGGVARFIQGFDMVEELDEYGRFVGWKIGKIHDRKKFEGLGIGPGDVVTRINGLPLERPAHAYEVLMSLKTAENIDVEYLRGGRVMRLSLPIVGKPAPKAATGSEKGASGSPEGSPEKKQKASE